LTPEAPLIQIDFSSLDEKLLIFGMYHVEQQLGAATVVQSKSVSDFLVHWILQNLHRWGETKVSVRSDPESAVKAILKRVADVRKSPTR